MQKGMIVLLFTDCMPCDCLLVLGICATHFIYPLYILISSFPFLPVISSIDILPLGTLCLKSFAFSLFSQDSHTDILRTNFQGDDESVDGIL